MHNQFRVRKSNATQRSQCHAIEIEHVHGNRFVEMQENEPFSPEAGEGRGRSRGGRPGVAGYADRRDDLARWARALWRAHGQRGVPAWGGLRPARAPARRGLRQGAGSGRREHRPARAPARRDRSAGRRRAGVEGDGTVRGCGSGQPWRGRARGSGLTGRSHTNRGLICRSG